MWRVQQSFYQPMKGSDPFPGFTAEKRNDFWSAIESYVAST